ncbi:MAG TPA: hypothetical protein VGB75_10420 [Jatrophihabitans sp.]|uniref:hypothetical protein n=1 Tax=Jatrophihabitans sp. TaxID=1932789 RepID=UPI002EECA9DC
MSIVTDARAYADLALEQGKSALSQAGAVVNNANKRLTADAPKPVLAALGAADMVAETLTKRAETVGKRVESLPSDAVDNVAKAQETGKALLSRTQDDALARITDMRERLDAGLGSVRALPALSAVAVTGANAYLDNAKQAFGMLTARGEAKLADLRKDPRVTKLRDELDGASSAIQSRLAPALGSVRSEVVPYLDSAFDAIKDADLGEPATTPRAGRKPAARRGAANGRSAASASSPARKSTAAKRSAAGKAPASKATAGKAPASKATAGKTSASKATAGKTSASKATAGKAPAKKA